MEKRDNTGRKKWSQMRKGEQTGGEEIDNKREKEAG